jgi:hypothetical protein
MFNEMFHEALPLIEKAAPMLAAALGCPYVSTATLAVNLISKAFGAEKQDLPTLVKNILEDPLSQQKLAGVQSSLSNEHKELLIDKLRLPSSAELNIKLEWSA